MTTASPARRITPDRFEVTYRMAGPPGEAEARARNIALEQTVELPDPVVVDPGIREHIVGRIVALDPVDDGSTRATISYAVDTTGNELTQLLNVIFGNSSIQPGLRVETVSLPDALLSRLPGPRFGLAGIRERLGVPDRPLLCTALKPMGLSAVELADLAYRFALGGIDIIKDDHGLADQAYAPFEERVARCVEAVERANRETGQHAVYAPNVSAPGSATLARARHAAAAGAGAALVMPGLVSFGGMLELAHDGAVRVPLLMHPAFLGSFVAHPSTGVAHAVLFGTFARLAGADATVFPNYGGRFAFSREECVAIADAARAPLGRLRAIVPVPGGGMVLTRVPELLEVYGNDVMLLIGGDLYRAGPDVTANARRFRELLAERSATAP